LGARGGAQVFDGLAGFGEVSSEAGAVGVGSEFLQLAAAEGAEDVTAQQLAEGFEFKNGGAGFQENSTPGGAVIGHSNAGGTACATTTTPAF
jgi:hypothetical protein